MAVTKGRGYFGIGVWHPKHEMNVGTLWRSAHAYGAAFVFTVGRRYERQSSDTVKTWRHIPLWHFENMADLRVHLPYSCPLIGLELIDTSASLIGYHHPDRACYLLGAEDHGLSETILGECHDVVQVPSVAPFCLNVAVAGSIVMYDRYRKRLRGEG